MKYFFLTLLILNFFWVSFSNAQDQTFCNSVKDCIKELKIHAESFREDYSHLNRAQSDFINHVVKFGEPLVDKLVPLLENPDENIATMAAAILRDVERIDKKYLPQIIKGLERGIGWLPPALGRINSQKAAEEAVKRFLVSESAPHNQGAYSVKLFGVKALPYILKAASCEYGCNKNTHYLLAEIFVDMGDEVKTKASKPLIEIVNEKNTSDELSKKILSMFRRIGFSGIVIEEDLLKLKKEKSSLAKDIDKALVEIGSNHSGKIFAEALSDPSPSLLKDIASRGLAAHDAGSEALKLINHSNPEIRFEVVKALGAIGYEEAATELVTFLWDPFDVRVNLAAAVSLGKLKAKFVVKQLEKVANGHWYPPVKKAAKDAIKKINNTQKKPKIKQKAVFLNYFEKVESCKKITLRSIEEPSDSKLYKSKSPEELKELVFKTKIFGNIDSDEMEQIAKAMVKRKTPLVKVTPDNIIEIRTPIKDAPNVALRVSEGWLAGSDHGEWGGDLVFISDKKEIQKILSENTQDIFAFGNRYIAVTGLSHLGLSRGVVYEIYLNKDKKWRSKPWRILPDAPTLVRLVETEELFIDTYRAGSLLLSKNGNFRMAECLKKE